MSNYCITFRIAHATVGGKSYDERRQTLLDNVRENGHGYWEETTSFVMAESALDTLAFGKRAIAGLSAKHDLVFIFDPSDMSAVYFGALEHFDILESFFPRLQKLP